jgi:ABC-type transport system involved in multi-copper enzyme maturation permease subunit
VFGPLVRFELRRISRRRIHRLRLLYALLLVGILCLTYNAFFPLNKVPLFSTRGNVLPLKESANFSLAVFSVSIAWLFLTIFAMTPAASADVVAAEKDGKTLEFLLVTDLTNWEIVAGKLAARVTVLLTFVLVGVPVLALLPLFGGVDPDVIAACAVAALFTLFGLVGLGAFCSVQARTAASAVGLAYGLMFGYLFGSGALWAVLLEPGIEHWPSTPTWTSPVEVRDVLEITSSGNPIAVVIVLLNRLHGGEPLNDILPLYLGRYVGFYALLGLLLGWLAVRRLRTVAIAQAGGKVGHAAPAAELPRLPPVGERPVLWRELYCEAYWPRTRALRRQLWIGCFLGAIVIVWMFWDWATELNYMPEMVNGILRGLGTILVLGVLLGASSQTVRALGKERARLTYDSLVLTDLRARELLGGKWLAAALSPRWVLAIMTAIWIAATVVGALHPLAIPALLLASAVYSSFFTSLGLWCSVTTPTTKEANARMGRVMVGAVGVIIAVGLLLGFATDWKEWWPPLFWGIALLPPLTFAMLTFRGEELAQLAEHEPGSLIACAVAALVSVMVYAYFAWRLWRSAVRQFQQIRPE